MDLAEETGRSTGPVVDGFSQDGFDHPDHGPDKRPGSVIFAAVSPSIAHILDFSLLLDLGLLRGGTTHTSPSVTRSEADPLTPRHPAGNNRC